MRIQPRQELLSVWKAIAKWSGSGRSWHWDDRTGRNSISDAELLLCFLLPPMKLRGIRFQRPDETSTDVCEALAALGNAVEIPQRVVRLTGEYLKDYTDPETGVPVFSGGGYFTVSQAGDDRKPTEEQLTLEVVDSYSTAVVLTTAVIAFLRGYRSQVQRAAHLAEIDQVETAARRRLTAAMVGLQRSFTLNVFRADSPQGRALCRTVSQLEEYPPAVATTIRHALREIVVGLRELGVAADRVANLSDNPDLLFECGWSWGVVRDALPVKTDEMGEFSAPGLAEPAPYLYFTVVAVDGIRDLFSSQTQLLGLLDEEQQRLARTLRLQVELAQRYWATIATLGNRWPVEDLPWRTTDEDETDYYSVLVTSLVRQDLVDRRAPDADLARIARVLEDLADRGRIRRRPLTNDPALQLHDPGALVALVGSEHAGADAPRLGWRLADLSTLLLGRALAVAGQVNDHQLRSRLLNLADEIWRHLQARRLGEGRGSGLWDQPANTFRVLPRHEEVPSWYFTTRVVQCLGTAADLVQGKPPAGSLLPETAGELLAEAEDVFDEEQLRGSGEGGPALRDSLRRQAINLRRARRVLATRPGTAAALLIDVLRELDKLAAAREPEAGE